MLNKEQIQEIVDEFNIDRKTNERPFAYRRFYMCNYLRRKVGVRTLREVAEFIGYLKHDNVVYAIKQHDILKDDSYYQSVTAELRTAIECMEQNIDRPEPTLVDRVLMCQNCKDMKQLQEWIKSESVTE